jgi:acyl-homoserine lactone acylase PvdQ
MRIRRPAAPAAALLLCVGLAAPPVAAQPPAVADPMRAFAVLPPGQDGSLLLSEIFSGGGPHVADQLERYAALPEDPGVADNEIATYFRSFQFGPEGGVGEEICPVAADVCILRDAAFGNPHVFATGEGTFEDAAYGVGYVTALDRLFEMDVFRHVASGRGAEFLGPDFLESDIVTRREGYTEPEVQAMIDAFPTRFGATGQRILDALEAYADGVNDSIAIELLADPPAEYAATGNAWPPEAWEPVDTAFIAILQLRALGETGGAELHNAALSQHLRKRLGKKTGQRVFEDLLFQNDRRATSTVPRSDGAWPSQGLGKPKKAAVAIPDNAGSVLLQQAREDRVMRRLFDRLGLTTPSSNAIVVGPGRSETGNPLQFGAPQVGYAIPSFFMDVDVHVPAEEIHYRGPAIPGASLLPPLGRGTDWAWTLTTGVSDAVDVRVERLCDPGGGPATIDSNGALFNGMCEQMSERTETIPVKESAPVAMTVHRTRHGPVFARATVKGDPVALVRERFFWGIELDSVPTVYAWATDSDTVEEFAAAAEGLTMSFNAHYANADHIAYFHLGAYPVRAPGVSPTLPSWGTGEWEWQGRFPFAQQPHVVDPGQGWLANWNSKPSAGWRSSDTFKWGSVHRVDLLADRMARLTRKGGTVSMAELVQVMADVATQDLRAAVLGRRMVRGARRSGDPELERAAQIVQAWLKRGGHRENLDRGPLMDRGAALAIFDAWYEVLVHGIFDDELGRRTFRLVADRAPITDYSPTGGSSFFFDWTSYVHDLLGRRKGYALDYCDDRRTKGRDATCIDQVVSALRVGLRKAQKGQPSANPKRWRTSAENLSFQEFGGLSVPEIPWQNRGTWNHVVEVVEAAP